MATDPWSNGCNHATHVQLWDMTNSSEVTNLCYLANAWTWQRSGDITNSLTDGHEYTVRVLDQDSNTLSIRTARLIIQQTDSTKITDTETSIDMGNYESTDSDSYDELTGKKIYEYDADKFSPTPTAYFEASLPESAQGPTIEQQIPIVTQRYEATGSTYGPLDNSLGIIHWDATKYTGTTIYFEAVLKKVANCWGGGGDAYAELYDITADASVSNSEIHTTSTGWVLVRSSNITLVDGNDYTVHLKNTSCVNESFIFLQTARLIIQQTDSTKIQDTQTHIDLGTAEATNSSSMTTQTNQKIYYYDTSKFSPTPTPYFEATFRPDSPIIEQQINIIDRTYTWPGSGWQPADNSLGWVYWDSSKYSGLLAVYAEYIVNATSGLFGSTEKMALFDDTNTT
jgi:hypothetical protein